MYGGRGAKPIFSRIFSGVWSESGFISHWPVSVRFIARAWQKSLPWRSFIIIVSPGFTLRAFFSITCHVPCWSAEMNRPSSFAPVGLLAKKRAGITFVSFRTRQSPGFRYSRISGKFLSQRVLFERSMTSRRESVRRSAGFWAISSWGRS